MTNIQNYALLDGKIVFTHNFTKENKKYDFRHPVKGFYHVKMHLRTGDKNTWHFAKYPEFDGVPSYGVSEEHLAAQMYIVDYYRSIGYTADMEISTRTDEGKLRRADVLVIFPDDQKYVFEIQKSPITNDEIKERTRDHQSMRRNVVWIAVDKFNLIKNDLCWCTPVFHSHDRVIYDNRFDQIDLFDDIDKFVYCDINIYDAEKGYNSYLLKLRAGRFAAEMEQQRVVTERARINRIHVNKVKKLFYYFDINFRSLKLFRDRRRDDIRLRELRKQEAYERSVLQGIEDDAKRARDKERSIIRRLLFHPVIQRVIGDAFRGKSISNQINYIERYNIDLQKYLDKYETKKQNQKIEQPKLAVWV